MRASLKFKKKKKKKKVTQRNHKINEFLHFGELKLDLILPKPETHT